VSFRSRLVLFFVLIVIVPMLAVAFLLFRLIDDSETGQADAKIAARHTVAGSIFKEQRRFAEAEIAGVGHDRVFAGSLQDGNIDRARRRARQLVDGRGLERIVFVAGGEAIVRVGDRRAIAPAVQRLETRSGRRIGTLGVAVVDATTYVRRVRALTGLHAVVLNGDRVLATTLPDLDPRSLPLKRGESLRVGAADYRVQNFRDDGSFPGQKIRVFTLGAPAAVAGSTEDDRLVAGAILLGFFLLAIVCAVLVSRTLQQQIAAFLAAARRLGSGDFSAHVPTVGHDEFAELGEEFNKMSRELAGRLEELTRERERVQDSMRRLGEAVGANLDRDALLELVMRTAVDGVGADAGRAHVRMNGGGPLQERTRVGRMNGLESAVASAEAEALSSGSAREATAGGANAIAHPLRGTDGREVVGVVSVGRAGRPFTPGDRELFDFLAGQAARSMGNVDFYETAARDAVTDHLMGLLNKRAFEEALGNEVERVRRAGGDVGLVLIDLDDFGQFNKKYGVLQGDAVLREVGRVLRESSREIDHPARYGGEELAVILPNTDLEGAYNRAERIREQIEQLRIPLVGGNGTLSITASCGVSSARGTAADSKALVELAGAALIEAKQSGKNTTRRAR
jgi:diguanylate cyclase (GGDEF)-like protein